MKSNVKKISKLKYTFYLISFLKLCVSVKDKKADYKAT